MHAIPPIDQSFVPKFLIVAGASAAAASCAVVVTSGYYNYLSATACQNALNIAQRTLPEVAPCLYLEALAICEASYEIQTTTAKLSRIIVPFLLNLSILTISTVVCIGWDWPRR